MKSINAYDARHTVALDESHEKNVVKKHGSFPSVTLYRGTYGDSPSRDTAISIYFCNKFQWLMRAQTENHNPRKARLIQQYLAILERVLLFS